VHERTHAQGASMEWMDRYLCRVVRGLNRTKLLGGFCGGRGEQQKARNAGGT
jgi:hypothetical protein